MTDAAGRTPSAESASPRTKSMDDIVALCRRRGFIWQSSEIYGGINGFWDYGPLGAQLKKNLKDAWWHDIIHCPPPGPDGNDLDIVPVDCTIIMNPKVWEASGHVGGFSDPMVDDKETKQRFRADHLQGVFLLEPTPDMEVGETYLVTQEVTGPPQATVIAGSPSEAASQIISDKKSRKLCGIKEVISNLTSGASLGGPNYQCAWVETSAGPRYMYVTAISDTALQDRHENIPSPFTGKAGSLTAPRAFNLMFETYVGALRDEDAKAYLRPETAQGIFRQFWNVVDTARVKVPFGMAQVGKAFRNEVTPRNFTFRSREFEQMEIEYFVHPDEAEEWYAYWREERFKWWQSIGLAGDNLQLRDHEKDELAHYAKEGAGTADVEYRFPFTAPGFGELEGVSHRADFDLKAHAEHCGKGDKMMYRDPVTNEKFFPHVIEPSAGADRGALALLCEAYTPDETRPSKVFMKFHPRMAPIKAGIFPLVNKDGMPEIAEKLYDRLRSKYPVQYDAKQTIGKRYARMDEAGAPYCFTVDGDTPTDNTVTVRDRDTAEQTRINLDQVEDFLREKLDG